VVWVTDANGCMDSTSIFVDSQVSIAELDRSLDVSVYPNPSLGNLTVELAQSTNGTLEVYGVDGKQVWSESINQRTVIQLDLSTEENGIYLLRVLTEHGTATTTIVIQ